VSGSSTSYTSLKKKRAFPAPLPPPLLLLALTLPVRLA
jgi:hypothetical protein